MSISILGGKRVRLLAACSILVPLCSMPLMAGEVKESLKMPKVSKSLLLDIEKLGDRIVIVGEKGHIIYSDDNAKTWQQADVPSAQMVTGVSFVNDKLGWAVSHDAHVLKSVDGGETWVLQRDGLGAQAEANVRALKEGKNVINELTQKLQEADLTADAIMELETLLDDAKWDLESAEERSQHAPIANPLLDVWFKDENYGWAVGAFGQFIATKNGGMTWHDVSQTLDNEMGFHLNAVVGTAEGVVFIGGEAGFLMVSRDNGQTWAQADIDSDSTIFDLAISENGSTIVSTGLRAKTFRSSDKGQTWQELQPNINFSLAGANISVSGEIVLVGAGGSVAYSSNNGDRFNQYTLPSRVSLSASLQLSDGSIVAVGEGGVHSFDPKTAQ